MISRFSPESSVRFDFAAGVVAGADGVRRLVVPVDLLLALLGEAPEAARLDFGRRLGTEFARRIGTRVESPGAEALEAIVDQLGGELALAGLGSLRLERWGRALVFVVESAAGARDSALGGALLAAILEGALQRLVGRDAALVQLGGGSGNGDVVRLVALSAARAETVRGWLAAGVAWGEVLSRLQSGVVENG